MFKSNLNKNFIYAHMDVCVLHTVWFMPSYLYNRRSMVSNVHPTALTYDLLHLHLYLFFFKQTFVKFKITTLIDQIYTQYASWDVQLENEQSYITFIT